MNDNTGKPNETMSECRALVALETPGQVSSGIYHADAPFLVQLAANVKGFSQYRAKRRAQPEVAAQRYRTTIASAIAFRPVGKKLNYCA